MNLLLRLRRGLVLATAVLLCGCGSQNQAPDPAAGGASDQPSQEQTDQALDRPLTPRALAWLIAEHAGDPDSAVTSTDVTEFGPGTIGVELAYNGDGEDDGDMLAVAVGTGFAAVIGDCATPDNKALSGCVETPEGLLMWEDEAPEEDPGVVYVTLSKGADDVLVFYSGLPITADPRHLDMPVSVQKMFAIALDPRVAAMTSAEAVKAGQYLDYWAQGH